MWSPLTAFLSSPPGTPFDGVDGGLIGDALARGGGNVIVNSVFLSLNLSDALLLTEQTDFLNTLLTRTMVGYGSGGSIGALLALGLVGRKGREE